DSSLSDVRRRITAASQNSWKSRIAAMTALVDDVIDSREARAERWDHMLQRVYRRARGRALRVALVAIAVWLLLFETDLVWWAARPLKVTAPPAAADAIVVFA